MQDVSNTSLRGQSVMYEGVKWRMVGERRWSYTASVEMTTKPR